MAAILKLIGWQRHTALVYSVHFCYQNYMLWLINTFQNKVSTGQYHMTILWAQVCSSLRSHGFLSELLIKCWFNYWITGSSQKGMLSCCQHLLGRLELIWLISGLKNVFMGKSSRSQWVNWSIHFSYIKTEGQTIQPLKNPTIKIQNSNQNSRLSWISLIILWTTWSRSSALGLAKSIYIPVTMKRLWWPTS